MNRAIIFFLIVSFVAVSAETIERTIEYQNKILVRNIRFFEDNFIYALCDEKLDDDGVAKCQVTRISNIFGKNNVTKTCDFTFKTVTAGKRDSNDFRNQWQLAATGADYAVIYVLPFEYFVIVRFEDCKSILSSLHCDSQVAELNQTFKELGINPDEISRGGFGVFINNQGEMDAYAGIDKKGSAQWDEIYRLSTFASEAKKLGRNFNVSTTRDFTDYYLYTKKGELKPMYWELDYTRPSVYVESAAHDYLTLLIVHELLDSNHTILQFDQDGKVVATYQNNILEEPPVAIYNLPEGGFYLLTPSRNSTHSTSLTKVDVKGERTHVLDLKNVKHEDKYADYPFSFYQNEDSELCLSWANFNVKQSTADIKLFTTCLKDVKIL